jgi:hypothetical protein
LLVLDDAPNHRCGDLAVPDNITLLYLPPYSPQLNPKENLWDEIREKIFKNYALKSMDAVRAKLKQAMTTPTLSDWSAHTTEQVYTGRPRLKSDSTVLLLPKTFSRAMDVCAGIRGSTASVSSACSAKSVLSAFVSSRQGLIEQLHNSHPRELFALGCHHEKSRNARWLEIAGLLLRHRLDLGRGIRSGFGEHRDRSQIYPIATSAGSADCTRGS